LTDQMALAIFALAFAAASVFWYKYGEIRKKQILRRLKDEE